MRRLHKNLAKLSRISRTIKTFQTNTEEAKNHWQLKLTEVKEQLSEINNGNTCIGNNGNTVNIIHMLLFNRKENADFTDD